MTPKHTTYLIGAGFCALWLLLTWGSYRILLAGWFITGLVGVVFFGWCFVGTVRQVIGLYRTGILREYKPGKGLFDSKYSVDVSTRDESTK